MCRLKKALYGHPDAGTYWEQTCDAHVRSVGFVPIGLEWPSCYNHPKLSLVLSVYVDDFKMVGPKEHMAEGCELLSIHIDIEDPLAATLYLRCEQHVDEVTMPSVTDVTVITYDMS